jgi:acyl dehydratase
MTQPKTCADLQPGMSLGSSDWLQITQESIQQFAVASCDLDPMHVDRQWAAKNSPFKTTIAFGFQTMSFLTYFAHQVAGFQLLKYALNYGFDRLRFIAPVPVDSRIRTHFKVVGNELRADGGRRIALDVTVEIEGQATPALTATWLFVTYESAD